MSDAEIQPKTGKLIPVMVIDGELTGDHSEIYDLSERPEDAFSFLDTYMQETDGSCCSSLQETIAAHVEFSIMDAAEYARLEG